MKRMIKKLAAISLAVVMAVTFMPLLGTQAAYAAGDYPDVQNVNISEEGVLTWDAYPGADTYWIGIDGGSLPTSITTYNLKEVIDRNVEVGSLENSGTHTITIEAYGGNSVFATWQGTYEYTSPYSPVTVGAIENVSISAEGIATWDPYPGTHVYWVGIDGKSRPTGMTEMDIHKLIDEFIIDGSIENCGTHTVRISADNERYIKIAEWSGSYYYESSEVPIVVGMVENVSISPEGIATWNSFSGADKYWIGIDGGFNSTETTSYDLKSRIDHLVEMGEMENSGTHTIRIEARDSGGHLLATWDGTYDYTSSAVPVVVGSIENVSISSDGMMRWDAYPDATTYWVGVNGRFVPTGLTTQRLDRQINQAFLEGSVGDSGTFEIALEANNERGITIGKWKGSFDYTVSMKMEECSFSGKTEHRYNGSVFKPEFIVDYMGHGLVKGTDYTVTYKDGKDAAVTDPTNAGNYYAAITGKGYYKGTVKIPFNIYGKKITPAVTLSTTSYIWNGKAKKPAVTVKDGSKKLAASDYTVTYKNNKNVGKGSATVKLKGNYTGSTSVTFTIKPKKAVISKAVPGKKQVKVTMKTKASATGGSTYQIKYRVKGASKWKTATTTAKTKTIKKLKKGKRYQIKVRAYKKVNGNTYYGAWSKAKTVTTKK